VSHLALPPGTVIDGYEILTSLGRGGMGAVYRVRRGGSELALKTLTFLGTSGSASEESIRFRREAELLASLSHPGIVHIKTAGTRPGFLYFVMQLVEGESLEQRLKRTGPLPATEAVRIVLDVADAIAHAHERGVVHRDLKPANILMEDDEHPLVSDFGLARRLGEVDAERLTRTGEVLGTPAFLAPEQAFGLKDELDEKTDVYGLGALLYAMLSGTAPFDGPSALAIMKKVSTEDPLPLMHVPPKLEAFVLRAMAKRRDRRPPSARAFSEELQAIALDLGRSVSMTTWIFVAVALASLAALGVAAFLLDRTPQAGKTPSIADTTTQATVASGATTAPPTPPSPASLYAQALSAPVNERIGRLEELGFRKIVLAEKDPLRGKVARAWLEHAGILDQALRDGIKSDGTWFDLQRERRMKEADVVLSAFGESYAADPSQDLMPDEVAFTLLMIELLSRGSYGIFRGSDWSTRWEKPFARFPDHPTLRFVRAHAQRVPGSDQIPAEALVHVHPARLALENTRPRPHTRVLAFHFVSDFLVGTETPEGDLKALLTYARYREEDNRGVNAVLDPLNLRPEPLPLKLIRPELLFGWGE